MIKLIRILLISKILSPKGFIVFVKAIYNTGLNLSTLLYYAAYFSPKNNAVIVEGKETTYQSLLEEVDACAEYLSSYQKLNKGNKIAMHCRNNATLIIHLMAASRIGCDVFLLNIEMTQEQLLILQRKFNFDAVICDELFVDKFSDQQVYQKCISVEKYKVSNRINLSKIKRTFGGKLVVLTGGTTGNAKPVARKTTSIAFMYPLHALLHTIKLHKYSTVFVAIPAFHGFGLAAIIVSIFLRKEIHLQEKYDTTKAADLISKHKIEVITLVPIQLQRLTQLENSNFNSLKVIISGGATICEALVEKSFLKLGPILYNLYGTSEAGFCVMATPKDLLKSYSTIGKPINGVSIILKDIETDSLIIKSKNTIGKVYLKSLWSISTKNQLIETGDLGYFDENSLFFLKGRADDMIVSGGENVFPKDVEAILKQHPNIKDVAVIGINDTDFGQRLKAIIVLHNETLFNDEEKVCLWLKNKIARFQMPKQVVFVKDLPYTAVGKLDIKSLKS